MDDTIVVGAPGHAGGSGAAYVFSRPDGGWANPYIVTKLTAPEFDGQIGFGTSVSMSGDAVLVGAPGTRYLDKAGEVFIFPIPTEEGEIFGEPVRLSDPHGGIGDSFGGVVSAGGNSVAIGALESDDHGLDFGAVYLFSEPTEGWKYTPGPKNYTAKLLSPDSDMGGLFGVSVSAIDSAIAVGAPDLLKDSSEGTAYVFARSSGNWLSDVDTVQLTPPDEDESHGFGWSVSMTLDTVAVAAPRFYDDSRQGAAYLYTKPDGGWASASEAAKLTPPPGEDGKFFGSSVSVNAGTAVVGAVGDQDEGDPGSAYLFMRANGGPWRSTSHGIKLGSPDEEDSSLFGWSVAITGDTLVVGMPSEEGPGAAYLYTKPRDGWAFVADPVKLTSPGATPVDMFGASVAISGDTVVIGAAGFGSVPLHGAAYVFTKPADGWASTSDAAKLMPEFGESGDWFGWSVAVRGDTVVVGAQNNSTAPATNAAYLFSRPDGGWVSVSAPPFEVAVAGSVDSGEFEVSVAIARKTVVIGASSETDPSAVYVFEDVIDE